MIIGIDPGLTGAIATLSGPFLDVRALPLREAKPGRKEIDTVALRDFILSLAVVSPPGGIASLRLPELAVIEDVNGDPKFGGGSAFIFGKTVGQLLATLQVLNIPILRASSQKWRDTVLGYRFASKDDAIGYITEKYPTTNLRPLKARGPSHDWAEACCMAVYGARALMKGETGNG